MRPVRLKLQAFGPFAGEEVIDFREAVAAGLFGIYGQHRTFAQSTSLYRYEPDQIFGLFRQV